MKKILIFLLAGLLTLSACAPSQPATSAAPPPVIILPSAQPAGEAVSYQNVSFILPIGLATVPLVGTVDAISATTDTPDWQVQPEHIVFQLGEYALIYNLLTPYIIVYPAQEYSSLSTSARESITNLQTILNGSAILIPENLPHDPSLDAEPLFAAQIRIIQFQSGSGIRILTEYQQYGATANNSYLFYQFQGLTQDGKYYIIAEFPVWYTLLAVYEWPDASIPAGGIPFPGWDNQDALDAYYTAVENLLNSAAPESFNPPLTVLDALIQSISIAP